MGGGNGGYDIGGIDRGGGGIGGGDARGGGGGGGDVIDGGCSGGCGASGDGGMSAMLPHMLLLDAHPHTHSPTHPFNQMA